MRGRGTASLARSRPGRVVYIVLVVGVSEEPSTTTPEQELATQWFHRERGIAYVLNHDPFEGERDCPQVPLPRAGLS